MTRTRKLKLRADFKMGVPELIVRADFILAYYIGHPAIPEPRPPVLPAPAELEEAIETLRDHYTEALRGDEHEELLRDDAADALKHLLSRIARYYEAAAMEDPAILEDTGFEVYKLALVPRTTSGLSEAAPSGAIAPVGRSYSAVSS